MINAWSCLMKLDESHKTRKKFELNTSVKINKKRKELQPQMLSRLVSTRGSPLPCRLASAVFALVASQPFLSSRAFGVERFYSPPPIVHDQLSPESGVGESTGGASCTSSSAEDPIIARKNHHRPSMPVLDGSNVRVIPNNKLYVSEPDPRWFGNEKNPVSDPAWTNENWLKSRFHFSFAEYHNPRNKDFGVLRVMNDDLVQPKRGFGAHPHNNMEIVTYIVGGNLTHKDSTGSSQTLGRGSIQFMTAGSGIKHSEFNHFEKPLRFIQTWIVPEDYGLPPSYGGFDASKSESPKNEVRHLASRARDPGSDTPVKLNQDVDCYAAELELGKKVSMDLAEGRQAYLLCVEGNLRVNGKDLEKHDGCEIVGNGKAITIEASGVEETENGEVAHFLMFSMAEVKGSGRKDL